MLRHYEFPHLVLHPFHKKLFRYIFKGYVQLKVYSQLACSPRVLSLVLLKNDFGVVLTTQNLF